MLKKILSLSAIVAAVTACNVVTPTIEVVNENLTFCEGTLVYGNSLLISNFGGDELNPLNKSGKGYIVSLSEGVSEVLIPADGDLDAPKGMAIKDNLLLIADVGEVVIYNLDELEQRPQIVKFPSGELFVNDIVVVGDQAYITVTNSGNIYTLDLSKTKKITHKALKLYTNVVGANGLALVDGALYVASYPADGETTEANVIYRIDNLSSPQPVKIFDRMGQYDGLALHDGKLYFTNWVDGEVGYIDLNTMKVSSVFVGDFNFAGPADISIMNDILYIPDLPNSRVVTIEI